MENNKTAVNKLSPDNVTFRMENGFPALTYSENGQTTDYPRVFFHRNFPFDMPWRYISVLDEESVEIGVLFDLEGFDEKALELIKTELERKYYEPQIKTILSLKERYGFSHWKVITTEDREVSFTMQDTFRNIIRAGTDKAIMLDVDGNRFVINSISSLDKKSYRKIEIYL